MTLYAPTDYRSITVPNGCGKSHEADGDGQLSISCAPCEAGIPTSWGWARDPEGVALTPDEIAQQEQDERAAQRIGVKRQLDWAQGRSDRSADAGVEARLAALEAGRAKDAADHAKEVKDLKAKLAAAEAALADRDNAAPQDDTAEPEKPKTPARPSRSRAKTA